MSMIDGSLYHQIGNPTNTVSYVDMSSTLVPIAGLDDLSFISTELLDFLFIQLRSAFVYGISGAISYRSASLLFDAFAYLICFFRVTGMLICRNPHLILFPAIHYSSHHLLLRSQGERTRNQVQLRANALLQQEC